MDYFELSVFQKRRWAESNEPLVYVSAELLLPESFDADSVYLSVKRIVQKYEILRAKLISTPVSKWPFQQILDISYPSHFQVREMVEVGNIIYSLTQNNEDGQILKIKIPLIFIDSFSFNILMKELFTPLSEDNEFDYLQFSSWHNDLLENVDEAHKEFWKNRKQSLLNSFKPIMSDPINEDKHSFEIYNIPKEENLGRTLRFLSRASGECQEECALACWLILISRNGLQSDVTLGINHPGRSFAELNALVGPMESMLPLSVSIEADNELKDVINKIRYDRQELEKHLEYFSWGYKHWDDHRMKIGYRYHSFDIPKASVRGYVVEDRSCELILNVFRSGDNVQFSLMYQSEEYSRQSIQILSEQFAVLLRELVERPTAKISDLKVVSLHHVDVIRQFNNPVVAGVSQTVPQRFESIVRKYPDEIAVVDSSQRLSYRELQQRVMSLMNQMDSIQGERVGLFLDPGADIPIAMLATLFSGRSFVPLDPDIPKLRLQHIIQDAGLKTLVTQKHYRTHLFSHKCFLLFVEEALENMVGVPNPLPDDSEADAYHIYTSGTTGLPKGVSISHRALINYVKWLSCDFHISKNKKSALVTSYAYDLGYTALWGTLLNGATLYMPDAETVSDSKRMLDYIKENELTYLKVTPSLLRVWQAVEGPGLSACRSLQLLFSGGEAFDCKVVNKFSDSDIILVNHYGPTETTIGAIAKSFRASELELFSKRPTLGRPIKNMEAVIVDVQGQILPPGIEGQLYLSGEGVANTYISKEELWSEKYKERDFQLNGKWYDTGDRARWTESGEIEFLGRRDSQLKIRGHRIETEEIESLISSHPSVSEAAVYQDPDNQNRLLAMVIPSGDAEPLRRLCALVREHDRSWTALPNGKILFEVNRAETEFMYHELIEAPVYFRNGIEVHRGDTVVDLGANIGLFSLSLVWSVEDIKLVSVEPASSAFECLKLNTSLHDVYWQVFQVAIGANNGQCSLVNYQHHTLLSTLKPDREQDQKLLLSLALEKHKKVLNDEERGSLRRITEEQLTSEKTECEMWTLSHLFEKANLDRVDLLKVDVQRAELDVLSGIQPQDWEKIQQIVMEVQDKEGRLRSCLELLKDNGFEVAHEQEIGFVTSDRYLLYASKTGLSKSSQTQSVSVSSRQTSCEPEALTQDLKNFLEDYLLQVFHPGDYVFADALPINANGKLARDKLSEHPCLKVSGIKTPVGAGVPAQLAEIWQDILKVDKVFLEDNFFDLGGDSLKSVRIVYSIQQKLNMELSMSEVLRFPVLSDFIRVVSKKVSSAGIRSSGDNIQKAVSLLPMQKQIWFLAQLEDAGTAYNMVRAISLQGIVDTVCLEQALERLLLRHEALRTVFIQGHQVLQEILDVKTAVARFGISFEKAPAESDTDKYCRSLLSEEMNMPFDFQQGLLFRARLIEVSSCKHILVLSSHHIVCDGVSFEIMMSELFRFYRALVTEEENSLPELGSSYRESLHHVLKRIQEQSDDATSYWNKNFSGDWEELNLPFDFDRSQTKEFSGAVHSVKLSRETRSQLETMARENKVSLFFLCLAVLKMLLHRWTGNVEITLGSTVSGRDTASVRQQVGYFANTIVLRDYVKGEKTFNELLMEVSRTALKALQYQYLELEKVLGDAKVIRRKGLAILYDVGFTWYLNEKREDLNILLEPCGLSAIPLELPEPPARLDLWFFVQDVNGELVWDIIYNKALFKHQTIEEFGNLIHKIFDDVLENPEGRVSEYLTEKPSFRKNLELNYELNL